MNIKIGRVRNNSKQQITSMITLNFHDLYTFALRMVSNQQKAERLVRKALMKITVISNQRSNTVDLKAALFKILYQTYLDGNTENINDDENRYKLMEKFSLYESIEDYQFFDTDETLKIIDNIQENDFKQMIENLPQDLRVVFLLNILVGFGYEQISYILNIPVDLVVERLNLANKIFQSELWQEIRNMYIQ